MPDLLLVVIGTVLVNHFVLARRESELSDPFAGGTGPTLNLAILSGCAFLLASTILLPLDQFVLIPFALSYVRLLVLAGTCAAATHVIRMIGPQRYRLPGDRVEATLPVANSALLVVGLQQVVANRSGFEIAAIAVSLAAGFGLLLLALLELFKRIDHPEVPEWFRGAPLTMFAAGLAALALLGLT